jgi:hypothetical protein
MANTTTALFDGMIALVQRKKQTLEETLRALLILKENAGLFPPEAVRALLLSIAEKIDADSQPQLFPCPSPPEQNEMNPIEDEMQLGGPGEEVETETESKEGHLTHFQKIVRFFVGRQNEPALASQIREGTKVSKGGVSVVLYRTHRSEFIASAHPQLERLVLWSLTDEAYKTALAESRVLQ